MTCWNGIGSQKSSCRFQLAKGLYGRLKTGLFLLRVNTSRVWGNKLSLSWCWLRERVKPNQGFFVLFLSYFFFFLFCFCPFVLSWYWPRVSVYCAHATSQDCSSRNCANLLGQIFLQVSLIQFDAQLMVSSHFCSVVFCVQVKWSALKLLVATGCQRLES